MPAFNKTGPAGQGPMTGQGGGACGNGRGFTGFGRGRGWCGRFFGRFSNSSPSTSDQKSMLKSRLQDLKDEKSEIELALKGLDSNK